MINKMEEFTMNMNEVDRKRFLEYITKFAKINEVLVRETIDNKVSDSIDMLSLNKDIDEYIELCKKYGNIIDKIDFEKDKSAIQPFLLIQIYKVYGNR